MPEQRQWNWAETSSDTLDVSICTGRPTKQHSRMLWMSSCSILGVLYMFCGWMWQPTSEPWEADLVDIFCWQFILVSMNAAGWYKHIMFIVATYITAIAWWLWSSTWHVKHQIACSYMIVTWYQCGRRLTRCVLYTYMNTSWHANYTNQHSPLIITSNVNLACV